MTKKKSNDRENSSNAGAIIKTFLVGLVLFAAGIIMFTGSIKLELGNDSLHASALFSGEVTVNYADIENVTYEKDIELGSRNFGIGSFRLQAGKFENDTFGNYKLYSYSKCKDYVVIQTKSIYVVINDKDTEKTTTLYKNILEKIK